MKVILLQDIQGTGKKDQILEISDGYARNYLLPRKMAKEAEVKARERKGKVIQIEARGGENGKLFGAVTTDQIAAALKAQHGVDVDRRKLELEEPIKNAGQFFVNLKLVAGINTRMIVNVRVAAK